MLFRSVGIFGLEKGVGVVYDVLLQLQLYGGIRIIMLIREACYFNGHFLCFET